MFFTSQKKTQVAIIAEIHHAFDSAQERLLAEARAILESTVTPEVDNIDIANRLVALGFTNAAVVNDAKKKVQAANKVAEELRITKLQADTIMRYQRFYPFLKFLTEAELDKICDKYSLIYAPVSAYIKDVPYKNVQEIENAQELQYGDVDKTRAIVKIKSIALEELSKFKGFVFENDYPNPGTDDAAIAILKADPSINRKYSRYDLQNRMEIEVTQVNRQGLFIAAPKDNFNLRGLKNVKTKGWFNTKTYTVKDDPIVFRYCRGGIQVLTKWGLEAKDPALVVPVLN